MVTLWIKKNLEDNLKLFFVLLQMWMRLPRKRSRTSWSSTTGPCWLLIHVAASPRSSVDLELVPATRSLTVNPPVHFHNKLEEQKFIHLSFFCSKLYQWLSYLSWAWLFACWAEMIWQYCCCAQTWALMVLTVVNCVYVHFQSLDKNLSLEDA